MQSSLPSSSCEPPWVRAPWTQVYDGAIAATLPPGWRNLGVRALCHAPELARPRLLDVTDAAAAGPPCLVSGSSGMNDPGGAVVWSVRRAPGSLRRRSYASVLEESRSPFRLRRGGVRRAREWPGWVRHRAGRAGTR